MKKAMTIPIGTMNGPARNMESMTPSWYAVCRTPPATSARIRRHGAPPPAPARNRRHGAPSAASRGRRPSNIRPSAVPAERQMAPAVSSRSTSQKRIRARHAGSTACR
eukprot:CAMPEP_0195144278 /NCGR_PEP_ID=MMETSP0448-20130528/167760_1 /TAXON_ID=66468 /ORGANISM="Heterocapsa triquestra, Strain CCMP 448" /LENGTH=107 /DNA_ID=CAMNT_0040182741 /DNA_START=173 /DNA_END=493 /DNA_ORIENTATION=+